MSFGEAKTEEGKKAIEKAESVVITASKKVFHIGETKSILEKCGDKRKIVVLQKGASKELVEEYGKMSEFENSFERAKSSRKFFHIAHVVKSGDVTECRSTQYLVVCVSSSPLHSLAASPPVFFSSPDSKDFSSVSKQRWTEIKRNRDEIKRN
ncbi:hypothetical protein B9Z55_028735 [Caenorhabditis nigoni]|uniref:Uncharacterized protein n=1 Tax=Caenorhabditis nigoni TaxID=1611254 RepID=A0A2G5SA28_9PELO|nr:hypothetical protein B9Z55_028735 [Caenorhabditis nigoni]